MKRIIFLLLLFFYFNQTHSQITKGNLLIGGSASFESTSYSGDDDNKTTIVQVMPNAGYFFMDKLAGGLRVSFAYKSNDGDYFRDLGIGPFARYYFLPATKTTNLFLEGHFLYGSEKYKGFDAESKTRFGAAAGPAFFLNQHIAIEAMLYWQSVKHAGDEGRYNTVGLAVGIQAHLFSKKK
jgi:hypothetical protein